MVRQASQSALLLLAGAVLLFSTVAQSAPVCGQLEQLGATRLYSERYGIDTDVIELSQCSSSSNNPVTHVQVRVVDAAVKIEFLEVVFGNQTQQTLKVSEIFEVGARSRMIDLAGGNRCVQQIRVVGNTFRREGQQGMVVLCGKRPQQITVTTIAQIAIKPPKRTIDPSRAPQTLVDAYDYRMKPHRIDADSRPHLGCDLKEIRLLADGGRLRVNKMVITFGNGSTQRVHLKHGYFFNHQSSRWIDLKGGDRCIKSVSFDALSPNNARLILQAKTEP